MLKRKKLDWLTGSAQNVELTTFVELSRPKVDCKDWVKFSRNLFVTGDDEGKKRVDISSDVGESL